MNFSNVTMQQALAQSKFFGLSIQSKSNTKMWFKIQIQIHFLKWIDNPIQIQSQSNYLRKNERQQTLKVFCLNVLDMEFPRDIFLSTNLLNARQMLIRNSLALLLEQNLALFWRFYIGEIGRIYTHSEFDTPVYTPIISTFFCHPVFRPLV